MTVIKIPKNVWVHDVFQVFFLFFTYLDTLTIICRLSHRKVYKNAPVLKESWPFEYSNIGAKIFKKIPIFEFLKALLEMKWTQFSASKNTKRGGLIFYTDI